MRTTYVAQASLFAEDELDLGQAVKSALVRCGYVVDWVQDGNTAWDYLLSVEEIVRPISDRPIPPKSRVVSRKIPHKFFMFQLYC